MQKFVLSQVGLITSTGKVCYMQEILLMRWVPHFILHKNHLLLIRWLTETFLTMNEIVEPQFGFLILKVSWFQNVFLVSSVLQKNKLENSNFCPSLLGQKFFVRFLEELKNPKFPLEINWPLEGAIMPIKLQAQLAPPDFQSFLRPWSIWNDRAKDIVEKHFWSLLLYCSSSTLDLKWLVAFMTWGVKYHTEIRGHFHIT